MSSKMARPKELRFSRILLEYSQTAMPAKSERTPSAVLRWDRAASNAWDPSQSENTRVRRRKAARRPVPLGRERKTFGLGDTGAPEDWDDALQEWETTICEARTEPCIRATQRARGRVRILYESCKGPDV